MEEKKTGARSNCGRRKIEDKKVPITVYMRGSVAERIGANVVRDKLYELVGEMEKGNV